MKKKILILSLASLTFISSCGSNNLSVDQSVNTISDSIIDPDKLQIENGTLAPTETLPLPGVEEGERVVTSGMGGVFPKGILVGTIFKVEKKNYGLFHDLYVEPSVDFSTLENVYVIKKIPDQEIIMLANEDDQYTNEQNNR